MPETSPLVDLARRTIEQYVREGTVPKPPDPLPEEMAGRAGVFVSIHTTGGDLRGCIGTFEPVMPNIAQEIIHNAVSAATQDPRFPPIQPSELASLDVSVDVLSSPEPCYSLEELDPKQYGVIVSCRGRRGLLLPDLDGVDTAEQQVSIAMRKAGIRPSEPIALQRFTVKRYHCVED